MQNSPANVMYDAAGSWSATNIFCMYHLPIYARKGIQDTDRDNYNCPIGASYESHTQV